MVKAVSLLLTMGWKGHSLSPAEGAHKVFLSWESSSQCAQGCPSQMCLTRLLTSLPCPHPQRVLMASDCAHVCAVLRAVGLTKIINFPPEGAIVFCCDFSLWPRQMTSLHICKSLQGWRWRSKEGSHPLPVGWHLALTSVRPTRTSRPQPPAAKFYFHGKPQWVTTHKLKIIFKGFCDLFRFFKPALPLYFSHSLTKNPGGVSNHLDTMQKAKE